MREAVSRLSCGCSSALRVAVDAAGEVWVRAFVVRHRQVDVCSVGRAARLVELASWEDVVLRAAILTDQTPQVAEAVAASELPEGLFAEEQRRRRILRR